MNGVRTLTVFARDGLSNRLRVLLSGMALAEASGRTFTMIWPRTPECGAAFHELFAEGWPVIDVDRLDPSLQAAWVPGYSARKFEDLLVAPEPHIVRGSPTWLIFPDRFPAHQALITRCGELVGQLAPCAIVADRVATFRARHFRPRMVGVHARRGDFVRVRPDRSSNTTAMLRAVDRFLAEMPEAGVLLCTDDGAPSPRGKPTRPEGVREIFRARYGDRLVETAPQCLDRHVPESIRDALVDLLLLRATDAFVGTTASTFSDLATFGRAVPRVRVWGASPAYRWSYRIARITGVHWLLRRIIRQLHGLDLPFPTAARLARRELVTRLARLRARGPRP